MVHSKYAELWFYVQM